MKLLFTIKTLLLAAVLFVPSALAATPEEAQFEQLKLQRAKAAPGTSEMLDQRYKMSLEQLLRAPGVAAQPELARQIQAELQATAGARAAAAATATPKPLGAPTAKPPTKSELKKLFENSQWRVTAGGPGGKQEQVTFTFVKDGQVSSSRPGDHWERYRFYEVVAPDVLKVFIRDPEKDRKSPFRAFRVDFGQKTARTDASLGGEPTGDMSIAYDQPVDRKK